MIACCTWAKSLRSSSAGRVRLMTPDSPLHPDDQQPTVSLGGKPPPCVGAKIGDSIGPFKILSVVGEGGFGVVYLAQQTSPV